MESNILSHDMYYLGTIYFQNHNGEKIVISVKINHLYSIHIANGK